MTYPPGPQNPYGQQPPTGSTPNPYAQQPQQPGYGAPQAPQAPQGYGYPPQQPGAYGYPPQAPAPGAFGYTPAGPAVRPPGVPMPSSEYAHWGLRAGALVIDAIIIGIIPVILIIAGGAMAAGSTNCTTDPVTGAVSCDTSGSGAGGLLVILAYLIGAVGGLLLCFLEGKSGQTLGRKALKITLVRESDGMPLGFGMAFVRRLAHFLDSIACYLGWLWPIWDDKKQTFADKVTSSVVMRTIGQ